MKKFFKIVLLLWIIATISTKTFANNIFNFNEFLEDIETVEKVKKNINIYAYIDQIEELQKQTCVVQNYENYSYISPVCLLKDTNYLTTEKSIEYLLNNLNNFYDMNLHNQISITQIMTDIKKIKEPYMKK